LSCRNAPHGRGGFNCYRAGNHVRAAKAPTRGGATSAPKILGEFDPVKFDENSARIRVDFGQNPRFIANDSFNAVC